MIIFTNRKIRKLFKEIFVCTLVLTVTLILLTGLNIDDAYYYTTICCLLFGAAMFLFCYKYFEDQNKIMEEAIQQITEYISGNKNVSLECNDEGELYRLFHEINTLVAILNAHADKESDAKKFLHNTISDISHQLKTPLAALNIYNGLLLDETKEYPDTHELVTLSEQELDRIEILVQNLLKISKLDSGNIIFEKNKENIYELTENVQRHFEFRAKQEGKIISISGDENIILSCDRNWMIEAIDNLVKNSLDHTDKGDIISIEIRQFASIVQIVVKDTGCGIHIEDMPYIFKRFYRSRYSKDKQGIGLGLPLTKKIVEAHNGTIEVDSTLGIGTTFTMNFLIPTKL